MSYAQQAEDADNLRLKRSQEALDHYRQKENEARRELASCVELTAKARAKHAALFIECEKRAGERRKAGLIENSSCY